MNSINNPFSMILQGRRVFPSEAEHLTKAQQGLSPQTKSKKGRGLAQALNAVDPEKNMSGLQKRLLGVRG